MSDPQQYPPPPEQPLVQHLLELRDRLLRVVVVILVLFLGLFAFANDLYTYLAEPLLRHMVEGSSMIATQVASPFLTPFKLALVLSVFIAVPYILYQAWGFIAPGLYQHERRLVFPLLFSSTVLFYAGAAFAYYVVFPLVFGFLTGIAPEGVAVMPDITYYLDFAIKMFFAFGLAFEVPIATILVVWSGMTTAEALAAKRPYVIVGAFVFGMLLTPPDVISQTLLAVPMWVLFELGLIFSRFYARPRTTEEDEENSIGGGAAAAAAPTGRVEPTFATPQPPPEHGDEDEPDGADYGDEYADANDSGHGEYEPLTEEEMDAELDRLEAEEAAAEEAERRDAGDGGQTGDKQSRDDSPDKPG
ncbi:MAG TPA: twin-arginine translocase subunit TatC [Gammaproteobacteria bacterium]|nr:twin-arginine translocase subunit TatC [Gammaproteobacteria bacterium]